MLENTFCHLPGVGPVREKQLWESGIRTWDDALEHLDQDLGRNQAICTGIETSIDRLARSDSRFFDNRLPAGQQFRLFHAFRHKAVYLDIETTGLSPWDTITTIALYDGTTVRHYVRGLNLDDFSKEIDPDALIITFNGKTFDLPFIREQLNVPMDQAHIDLRYVLAGLGYKGGLKKCERAMGLHRGDLDGVDGSFAVLLWDEYQRKGDSKALETLLAYNIEDVLNLEILMVRAYNMKAEEMGMGSPVKAPCPPPNPFAPDMALVARLKPQAFF